MTRKQIEEMLMSKLGVNSNYYKQFSDSTLSMVSEDDYAQDFSQGAGNEINPKLKNPKFLSVVSSAALAVNAFAPWKKYLHKLNLKIGDVNINGFEGLIFEKKLQNGLHGTPPHIDIWLWNDEAIVAIESKFCELLDKKVPKFSDQYSSYVNNNIDDFKGSPWINLLEDKSLNQQYKYLDVAQLIKHYFGLKRYIKVNNPKQKVFLLYLYWSPSDTNLCKNLAFVDHDEELKRFAKAVSKDSEIVFKHMTYQQLFTQWNNSKDTKIQSHLEAFRKRYLVI